MEACRFLPFEIKFNETMVNGDSVVAGDVQLLRVGSFAHPVYGKVEITPTVLADLKKNFDANVRKIDLAIDYKHDSEDVAAGWIRSVYLSDEGQSLWAKVEWTPKGRQVLMDKEFRYLSADFHFDYQDNETLTKHGPTLLGAGLTNRPVVKGMAPTVQLTEISEERKTEMTIEQLKDENKKLSDRIKLMEDEKEKAAAAGMSPEEMKLKMQAMEKELGEAKAKLAEYETKMGCMEKEKQMAEKKTKFDTLLAEGKVVEAQRQAFMDGDAVKLAELAGKVNLSQQGHGGAGSADQDGDPADQVMKLAEKKLSEKAAKDLKDAISMVLSENPELAKKYLD